MKLILFVLEQACFIMKCACSARDFNVYCPQYVLGFTWSFQKPLMEISLWIFGLQILPEKYSYHRRFDPDANHATDCVICMTAIDLTQRSSDCMVYYCDFYLYLVGLFKSIFFNCELDLNCISLTGNTMRSFLSFWLFAKVDGHKDGMPYLPAFITTSLKKIFHFIHIT